ncbi:MAG TPA: NAD(P)H-hydrate dehydratase [Thermoanaerobaculia bacterium]|nr:NAD(P)H-hydrate dehydratase [Thermoanaerobaculia bacterium]
MKIIGAEEARALDARTIAAGTPGIVLMERAAAAVAREVVRAISSRPERAGRVVVLAGTGNNGGDGFETAWLLAHGPGISRVETLLVGRDVRVSGDAAEMLRRLRKSGGFFRMVENVRDLGPLAQATLIVDALFGTGLSRPIEDPIAMQAVEIASAGRAFVVAVDVPSGLNAGKSELWHPHVRADVTVTFGLPKTVHAHLPSAAACGRIVVADIGLAPIPESRDDAVEAVVAEDIAPLFPRRRADSHKGTYGRVGVIGGSLPYRGAVALAARAAHRSGAGLVTVVADEEIRSLVHAVSPETTSLPAGADPSGFDALAVGPGLGTGDGRREVVERIVALEVPAVFDADALNVLAGEPRLFRRKAPTVLTPHPGEAARLLGMSTENVNAGRVDVARRLALESGAAVVLKGFRSVVADPRGRAALVLAGNPGMATGGTGDVLTGVVASFLARGLSPYDAARAAAFLHGSAGDLAREAKGEDALLGSDLVDFLPEAFFLIAEGRPR